MTKLIHKIICGDCIEVMPKLESKSIDMILCDLPYGTTTCAWDTIIPFESLWEEYKRLIRDNGAIVLTASQPFTSALVMSNPKMFRYCWIWEKEQGINFLFSKKQPIKVNEEICVFYKEQPIYNPQMMRGNPYISGKGITGETLKGHAKKTVTVNKGERYPRTVIKFNRSNPKDQLHPTQKPISLFEYLIKTYTNETDSVLDNCIGSGTTLVAAERLGRNSIGIEINPEYCEIAYKRLLKEVSQIKMDREPSIIERIGF